MKRFKEIFEGNNSAYGQLILNGAKTAKGKAEGRAFIKRGFITEEMWNNHIEGAKDVKGRLLPALGIIPINENNECKWGCIDVDQYNIDHIDVMNKIKEANLPLITFRSKSGGAHLFLFTKEFIPAGVMQSKLETMSEALGFGGSEIFPKQDAIEMDKGDTGNFLNLPYHGGTKGLRYALTEKGEAASLESFYSMYDSIAQTLESLNKINIVKTKTKKAEEAFPDGPPCLNQLAIDGFGEGSRNNALFNVAVFCKKAHPDDWENQVGVYNQKYMDPPLNYSEVQVVIKSVTRKGYDKYRCKDQPICGVCNAAKCRTKIHGVGYKEEQMPEMDSLSKIKSNPPQWFLNVDGKRIELKTEQLHNPNLFAIAVLEQANIVCPIPKGPDWREIYLKNLMEKIQEIEPLESLDPTNQIVDLLYEFTVNRPQARAKDDITNKMSWTDSGFTYFRMADFFNFCKKNHWELDKTKTYNLLKTLKDIYNGEERHDIKNSRPRLIKIKAMKQIETKVSKVEYQGETPF